MRVARLELTGIGPFEGAVFEIPEPTTGTGELVFFEGPNGSGKTTIAQAIAAAAGGMPQEFWRRLRGSHGAGRVVVVDGGTACEWYIEQGTAGWGAHVPPSVPATRTLDTGSLAPPPLTWASFAYHAGQVSAVLATAGPRDIDVRPLLGALSFGDVGNQATLLGQLLVNLENERTKAVTYASEAADETRKRDLAGIAESRREALSRFEEVFSRVLDRRTTIEFTVGQQAPVLRFDGQEIPLDLLGEGLRSTMAWLSDLLVRLERIHWADTTRSPLDQDFWLILDEIDESLHPTMQARIYPALRKLFPNARIYATTHSPFVVASVGEGVVFPIRPGKDHQVRGRVESRQLEPGQTLEWVTTEIFEAQVGFIDEKTRALLDEHKRDIRRFRRTKQMDWEAFFARRSELFKLNDEVRVAAAMEEVSVRLEVDQRMLARAEAREQREHGTEA